eukprot:639359_1
MNQNRRFPPPSRSRQYLDRNKNTLYSTTKTQANANNTSKIDIDNDRFDISKLRLTTAKHRAQFCLAFLENGHGNELFYDQLSEDNMAKTNALLCYLYDKYHPTAINTTCGARYWNKFHVTLMYDHHSYVHLLSTIEHHERQLVHEYVQHFNKHSSSYIQKHKIVQSKFLQNDLKQYVTQFKPNRMDCFPKIRSRHALKPNFSDRMVCKKNMLFDVTDTKRTVLYLEHDTNIDSTRFKMIDYAPKIHAMIKDMIWVAGKLIHRTSKYKSNAIQNDALFDWYKINLTTRENITQIQTIETNTCRDDQKESEPGEHCYKHSVVIRVELHLSILNFIFFVAIYKQYWLQQAQNKGVFQKWYNAYCDHINAYDVSQYTKREMNKKFNCRDSFNCDKCRVILDWRN